MDGMELKTPGQQDGQPSRREFLTRAGLLAGGMALLGLPGLRPALTHAALSQRLVAASFALELDGVIVGMLKSTDGGFPRADVISEPTSPFVKKHLGPHKFDDIVIEVDPIMPQPLFDWVNSTLNLTAVRKTGAIITADANFKEQSRLQFSNAAITEVGFPACDAASKDPGLLTIKFAPEFAQPMAGRGVNVPVGLNQKSTLRWVSSNFSLNIDGLDCRAIRRIDAFTIARKVTQEPKGQIRTFSVDPARVEFPNLALTLPEASAGTFYAWFEDMVIKGNAGEQHERTGTLELLDATRNTRLLTIAFHNLGIFGFSPGKSAASGETIKQVNVDLYCERVTLKREV